MKDRKSKQKKLTRKQRQKRKIIVFIVEIIVLLLLLALLAVWGMYRKIDFHPISDSEAGINTDLDHNTVETQEGYMNIAVFGLDNRGKGKYDTGHADTIMIARIDNKTKEVKLVSVYRDTFLSIGNGKFAKANGAYANGGPLQAVQMLNSNLDLNITEYVSVDWAAVVQAIDGIGGVDIELTSAEVREVNRCIIEIDAMTGKHTKPVKKDGLNHLNGTQATAYARIRKLAGDDFKRASRQRIVIEAMLNKAKTCSVGELTQLCNDVFDDISTSLEINEILYLVKDVAKYNIKETTGFPFALTTKVLSGRGDCVIPVDLSENVAQLHKFLFMNEEYVPSNTVEAIDASIIKKTGVTKDSTTINTDKYNDTSGQNGTSN